MSTISVSEFVMQQALGPYVRRREVSGVTADTLATKNEPVKLQQL
jgi:hypothetical protein